MDDERVLTFRPAPVKRHAARLIETPDVIAAHQAVDRLPARGSPRLEPDTDLKVIVGSLMETLAAVRDRLGLFDRTGKLRRLYERLRCELETAGFPVGHATPFDRAAAHRRLGELAEARGDPRAALRHYALALRSHKNAGCRRALNRLQREHPGADRM